MKTALDALLTLQNAGYPFKLEREVSPETLASIEENARTIAAALRLFGNNAAVNLNVTAGAPEQK